MVKDYTKVLCIFIILLVSASFGQVISNFNLQSYIDNQLLSNSIVTIPPGKYYIPASNGIHLRLHDLSGVEIAAYGVEMICAETTRALDVKNCQDLVLRGLSIDNDPLNYIQGEITAIFNNGLTHQIRIFGGYPDTSYLPASSNAGKYEIYDPVAGHLRFGSYYNCKTEIIDASNFYVHKPSQYAIGANYQGELTGDHIVVNTEYAPSWTWGFIPHAVALDDCSGILLEDVTLYNSCMFGFYEIDCSGTSYVRCGSRPRPLAEDFKPREVARIRSLNADGFHSVNAPVGPSYIDCFSSFHGDDCIAINGSYHLVMGSTGADLRVLSSYKSGDINIAVGDTVEIIASNGLRLADALVLSVVPGADRTAGEDAIISSYGMHAGLKDSALDKGYTVTLDRPVSLGHGSLIANKASLGNGFVIRGGKFGDVRSRGFLIGASDGIIEGVTLEYCTMQAIKVAHEFWWLLAGSANNIIIRNNILRNNLNHAISVHADDYAGRTAPGGAHSNIQINNNLISGSPQPGIHVTSTVDLCMSENTLNLTPDQVDGFSGEIELVNVQVTCTNTPDLVSPQIEIIIGPTNSLLTNQPFALQLAVDEPLGFWSTNGWSASNVFSSNSSLIIITTNTIIEYYARDIAGNCSLTNGLYFDFSYPGNTKTNTATAFRAVPSAIPESADTVLIEGIPESCGTLQVLNMNAELIYDTAVDGSEYYFNKLDRLGKPLPPGAYILKACGDFLIFVVR